MLSRREFLHRSLLAALGGALAGCSPDPTVTPVASLTNPAGVPSTATAAPPAEAGVYLSVARGPRPEAITRAAIDALGGMSRFVKAGNDVIIKPNICTASLQPEYAATSNPDVVAALVSMCLEAGAERVRVMDQPFSGAAIPAYKNSGIREAVERAGGQMEVMSPMKYAETSFPRGRDIKKWQVYQDILKADVLINVPIAKTHDLAKVTLAMKGLMGVIIERSSIHNAIDQRIADLSTVIKPTLNVIDGVRVLAKGGPTSWNLGDVVTANTIIASRDIVAADAYAAKMLFNLRPEDIGYIRIGSEMGLGRLDLSGLNVKQVTA